MLINIYKVEGQDALKIALMHNGSNKNWYNLLGNHFGIYIMDQGKKGPLLSRIWRLLHSSFQRFRIFVSMIISRPAERNLFSVEKSSIYYVYFSLVFVKSLIRSYRSHVCFIACEMLPEGF